MRDAVGEALARPRATVEDVVAALAALPEMRAAATRVLILHGSGANPARNVAIAHGALTNGGYAVARACFEHGVDTVVYIHIDGPDLQRLRADGRGTSSSRATWPATRSASRRFSPPCGRAGSR